MSDLLVDKERLSIIINELIFLCTSVQTKDKKSTSPGGDAKIIVGNLICELANNAIYKGVHTYPTGYGTF